MTTAGGGGEVLSPILVGAIKGLEYGCLGLLVAWVGQCAWGGAAAHVAVGPAGALGKRMGDRADPS